MNDQSLQRIMQMLNGNLTRLTLKTICFTVVYFLGTHFIHAQPIINRNVLPEIGDTLFFANDNLLESVTILPDKGKQEWDFMKLQSAFSKKIVAQKAVTSKINTAFSEANLVIEDLSGIKNYYHLHKNALKLVGTDGVDPYQLGLEMETIYEPALPLIKTPIEYGTIHNSSGRYTSVLLGNNLPVTLLYSLPILPDSVRFISTVETSQEVDAWGHLVLPDNSFEVLREKRITITKTRLEIKVNPFPWRDVTDDIYTDLFTKKQVQRSYHFYSNETAMPVLVAYMKEDGINVENVEYLVSDPNSTTSNTNGTPDVFAYPNPAIGDIRFEFSNLPPSRYQLKIFNIIGMSLMEKAYYLSGFSTIKWDVSELRKGTYLYSLIDDNGNTIATRRLIIIRP